MLRASVTFFILGIVSMLLGMNGIAGLSIEIGKILLVVFVVLAVISFFFGRKKGGRFAIVFMVLAAGAQLTGSPAFADDSLASKTEEVGKDTKRAASKAVRGAKEAACKLVNGKTECAVQKIKHSVQNGADHVEDAID